MNRLPKQALKYKPKGRRNIGRPRKRWSEQLHLEEHDIFRNMTTMMMMVVVDLRRGAGEE